MRNIFNRMDSRLLTFAGLEFFFWAMCSAYYPYLVVFLSGRGYSNTVIGTIIAVNSIILVLAQPFWGMVSDWQQSIKKVFIVLLVLSAGIMLSLPLYKSVLLTGIVLAILTFFESSMPPLLDCWVIQGLRNEQNIHYGAIRLWGSIGFAIMVYVFGIIIDKASVNIILPFYAIFAVINILICLRINSDQVAKPISLAHLKIGRLLKNYHYIVFIIFASVLFIPHKGIFSFLPKHIEALGGNRGQLGDGLFYDGFGRSTDIFIITFSHEKV